MIASRLISVLSIVSLLLVAAAPISCGGSSSSGGGKTGPFNVVGNWQANFSADVGTTTSGNGAIDSSGLAAFFDNSGNIVQFPTITGATSFSGNLTAYAVNGDFFSGGAVSVTDTAQGDANPHTFITGTFTGSPSGTFTVNPFSPLSGAVVPITGMMNGKLIGFSDTLSLTFSPSGSFTGGDSAGPGSGCNLSGTLTQVGSSNVFDITYNSVSGDCTANTQTGIAFESTTDYFNVNGGTDANYLYVMLLTSTLSQVRPGVAVIYQ